MLFGEIAAALDAQQRAARIALRRALDGFAARGRLGKRARSPCTAGRVTLFGLNRGDHRISPLIVG
jgi:hypothetical protein